MFCPRCGANNEANQRFCYNCGSRIEAASQGATTPLAPPIEPEVLPPPTYEQSLTVPPAPAAYGSPAAYPPVTQNSGMAIASLVCGILAWVGLLPLVGAIAAIVLGHIARSQIRGAGGQISGKGLALAGLILGYLQIAFVGLAICLFIAAVVGGVSFS